MEKVLTPAIINRIIDLKGRESFSLALSLEDTIKKDPSIVKRMIAIQERYAKLIKKCRVILREIQSSRKSRGDPLLKWSMAKSIVDFIESTEKEGFYITNISNALSRDLKVSVRQINYLKEFARSFPKIEMINPKISWDKYKEILDIKSKQMQKECIRKILAGELRTREDIRKFKRLHKNFNRSRL